MKEWKTTWGYAETKIPSEVFNIKMVNHKQKIAIVNNLYGDGIKIQFSNLYGDDVLVFRSVTVSCGGADEPRSSVPVTFKGETTIKIGPGEKIYSDAVPLKVSAGKTIIVETNTEESAIHGIVLAFNAMLTNVQRDGEINYQAKADDSMIAQLKMVSWLYGITEIAVYSESSAKTIVTFGDSITHMSFWSVPLTLGLYKGFRGQVSVKNCGVTGNRILHDSPMSSGMDGVFGRAGISRFEEDVFGTQKVDAVLVLEGINDICQPVQMGNLSEAVGAEELIEGLKKYANIAHKYKSKAVACTILPFGGYEFWSEELENIRLEVNDWIRNNDVYDGFLDFDVYLRSSTNPQKMVDEWQMGDYLHPNPLGGMQIAKNIDLDELMKLINQ